MGEHSIIDARGLTRTYAMDGVTVSALRGVDLKVSRGEFIAIMGSSGSGKSTLLHILGCLDRPSTGDYWLEGAPVENLTDTELAAVRARRIGFVFQHFGLLPRTSAAANVMLPLLYSGQIDKIDREAHAGKILELVGLREHAWKNPNQLSGGQQQRVALARALINDPAILLADEPTGNLDSATSHEVMSMIRTLNVEHGVSVVLVTHEPDVAAYADRIITLRDGCIADDRGAGTVRKYARGDETADVGRPASVSWSILTMTVSTAFGSLLRNTLRSVLTMIGVFIGVAALISMIALGEGAKQAVNKQIASLGTSLFVILPGASTANGVRAGNSSASTLTVADANAIKNDTGAVERVSYINRQVGQVQYRNQNWNTAVEGVTPDFLRILDWHIAAGRSLSKADGESSAMVGLIGQTVYHKLFASDDDPVGATILVRGKPLRIVGLLASRGQSSFGTDQDDVIMLPFQTAESKVIGVAQPVPMPSPVTAAFPPPTNPFGLHPKLAGMVNLIFVEAHAPELVDAAMREVTATLKRRHFIRAGDTEDFSVRNLSEIAEAAQGSSRVIALLLAILASISLLVGGIGIMNIMIVSVTERTREIGIRMAVGARRLHVMLQFLVEAGLISLIGGMLGLLVGVGASLAIATVAHWPIVLSFPAIAGSLAFSAFIGVFFGFYPARKAARLNPVEAFRFE